MKRELGPLKLEIIHGDIVSFYRFFYRQDNINNDRYEIRLNNIVMKRLNLHTQAFTTTTGLEHFLSNITNNTTNISSKDLTYIRSEIWKFKNPQDDDLHKSCLEIILPIIDGNDYTQSDIDEIYNTAVQALGI